jgi:hypothetical protein
MENTEGAEGTDAAMTVNVADLTDSPMELLALM